MVWKGVDGLLDKHFDQKKQWCGSHAPTPHVDERIVGGRDHAELDMWRRDEHFNSRPDAIPDEVSEKRSMRMRLKQRSWQVFVLTTRFCFSFMSREAIFKFCCAFKSGY